MADALKCDICGSYYDRNDEECGERLSLYEYNYYNCRTYNTLKIYDLCPQCYKDISNFIQVLKDRGN